MKIYKSTQVFVPGGMPKHTYIDRTERELEDNLRKVEDNLCKLVTLTGATKSGKTVLVNRIFPRANGQNIWIDGGTVSTEDDIWTAVLESLGGHSSLEKSESAESGQSLTGDAEAEAGVPLVAKAKGKIGAGLTRKQTSGTKKSLHVSPRISAITQLRDSQKPLIIDDFHYLDRQLQASVIRALKPLVFDGHAVVIIAIPHRRYDAVKVEREMTGRLEGIPVPVWSIRELMEIPEIGFPLLNIKVSPAVCQRMAEEAYGSPHLMQEFCKALCVENAIKATTATRKSINSISDQLFKNIAEGTGKVVFDKLAKGPRQRSDRMPRPLVSGGSADIYRVVLLGLARLAPGMEKVDYEALRSAIREVLADSIPQAHEVSRVLDKMTEIASDDEAATPVIDWVKADQELHVTDPFFAFFLKWGES